MTKHKIYIVDAFAEKLFSGNPAAVCITDEWLEDELMQSIAAENNLSETAFLVPNDKGYSIRWFTPVLEVDLCGHATLASAFVLFQQFDYQGIILFHSPRSGKLEASQERDLIFLDFPTDEIIQTNDEVLLQECINMKPLQTFKGKTDFMAILESEEQIINLEPNIPLIGKLPARGLIVTSPGQDVDFVSRFFAPQCGVDEDPVTGSAHTSLTPLWSNRLGKKTLIAKQLSQRGGTIHCQHHGDRCKIGGSAQLYMQGTISVL